MAAWRVRGVRLAAGDDVDAGVDASGRWTSGPPVDALVTYADDPAVPGAPRRRAAVIRHGVRLR